jgi:hypothetical protein
MSGFWRAVLVGALLAVLVVAGLAAAFALGVVPGAADRTAQASDGPVLVALVLPDADGITVVRVLTVFERAGDVLRATAVDPLTSATVPGTSATTLAEAYSFGGGAGVANAYAQLNGARDLPWVVVTPKGWTKLTSTAEIPVTIPADIEVFDGTELYSYAREATGFPAPEVDKVMNGAAHLSDTERAVLRDATGSALTAALVREGAQPGPGVETNMEPEEFAVWLSAAK